MIYNQCMNTINIDTPVGKMYLSSDGDSITELKFGTCEKDNPDEVLLIAKAELEEYFEGTRKSFTVSLKPKGTVFQQSVWKALCEIPYGETATYGEIAKKIGNEKACRAVGMANNRNPIAIIIPCHRVIGAGGSLTGYAGGLDKKELLLSLEAQRR